MRQTRNYFYTLTLCLYCGSILLISCGKEQEIVTSALFSLQPFDTILLEGIFDVELIQGEGYSLQFRGDKNVTTHITFDVRDGVLSIDNKNSTLWTQPQTDPPLLYITADTFYHIEVKETGSVISRDTLTSERFGIIMNSKLGFADLKLNCNLVYFWNASPSGGLITLRGKTKFLHLFNSNLLAVDARQLPCAYAIIENSSKGDIHVQVSQQLNYSITGTGNIYLHGDPVEIFPGDLTSTGRLIR